MAVSERYGSWGGASERPENLRTPRASGTPNSPPLGVVGSLGSLGFPSPHSAVARKCRGSARDTHSHNNPRARDTGGNRTNATGGPETTFLDTEDQLLNVFSVWPTASQALDGALQPTPIGAEGPSKSGATDP